MIIALDTSTAYASLALYGASGVISEFTWLSHRDQTVHLLPLVQTALDMQSLTPAAFTGVAVATGPGSFTGLRVAVSTAKGLALTLGLPLFGISSLDVQAEALKEITGKLACVVEAGRGRVGAAFYDVEGGQWQRQSDYFNLSTAELIAKLPGTRYLSGELSNEQRAEIHVQLGDTLTITTPAAGLRRTAYLAEIVWRKLQAGESGDDLASLEPIYLHQSVK